MMFYSVFILMAIMILISFPSAYASGSSREGFVYITGADKTAKTVDLYYGTALYKEVKVRNFDKGYAYAGVMEYGNFSGQGNLEIDLFDVVPMDQTIGIVDAGTITVNGIKKPLASGVKCFSTVGGFKAAELQAANNKGGLAFTAAAVRYDNNGKVAELYYTRNTELFPGKTVKETAWLGDGDRFGKMALDVYGVVTLQAVFGVYDEDGKRVEYMPGTRDKMSAVEAVFETIPAIVPFNYGEVVADGSRNTYPKSGLVFKDKLDLKPEGSNNSALLALNKGVIKAGAVDIRSSSVADSAVLDTEINTGTNADEFSNKDDLKNQPNNKDYFNVKTNEMGSQWGINSVVFAFNRGKIYAGDNKGERSFIEARGSGGNLLWATGIGSEIFVSNADIIGYNNANHATDVTYGGHIVVDNVFMETFNGTSTALTTDFGGGAVNATSVTAITHKGGSAGAYVEGGAWVTADNSRMGGVFKSADEALAAMSKWQKAIDQAGGERPVCEIDNGFRNANMIWAIGDGAAVASHHGWIDYTSVNMAGPYGVLLMNSSAPLQARVNIKDSCIIGWGEANKSSTNYGAYRPVSALIGVYGGGGIVNIENTLLVVNTRKTATAASRRDPWAQGTGTGPEAGTKLDQYNYLVYGMTNSFMIYNFTGEGIVNFKDCGGEKTLKGDIFVEGQAKDKLDTTNIMNINLINSGLKGRVDYQKGDEKYHAGVVNLTIDQKSTWKVTGDSCVTKLTVSDMKSITADSAVTVYYSDGEGVTGGKVGNVTFVKL